jgi:hypothetical protein
LDLVIAVVDMNGSKAPAFLRLPELPVLHLDPVPKGYLCCPFEPVDERVLRMHKVRSVRRTVCEAQPPEKGYCEICCMNYAEGEAHRDSVGHQKKLSQGIWSEFDEIARSLPMDGTICR